MKSSPSTQSSALYMYVASLALAVVAVTAIANGCVGGSEGDRCNPALSHDECGGTRLTCQQPATCVESFCCPNPASASTNPYCNGTLCPVVDAGPDASDDAGASVDAGPDGGENA